MVFESESHRWLSKAVNDTEESADILDMLKKADDFCQQCTPTSPTLCVERCEIWRAKNEFLEMNGTLCSEDYFRNLLNAIKNKRRQEVVAALSERPRGIKGLQEHLKTEGHSHSQSTIANTYVEPLLETGLVRQDNGRYKLTFYGQRFWELFDGVKIGDSLPSHSRCYEEKILRELKDGPHTYEELAEAVNQNILSRSIQRLKKEQLVNKSKSPYHIFYFRTKKAPKKRFSPTEKRVYRSIPEEGISVPELSEKATISLRRTYKYLRRLRKRKLVFTRSRPRTYQLTQSGREITDFLEETADLIASASKASTYLLARSRQTMATPDFQ